MVEKYQFEAIVCGTTQQGGPMERFLEPMRSETQKVMWHAILQHSRCCAARVKSTAVTEN